MMKLRSKKFISDNSLENNTSDKSNKGLLEEMFWNFFECRGVRGYDLVCLSEDLRVLKLCLLWKFEMHNYPIGFVTERNFYLKSTVSNEGAKTLKNYPSS